MPAVFILALGFALSACKSTKQPASGAGKAPAARVLFTNAIPIEIKDDHVFVDGVVNGRKARLVLDTGATHVVLSPETAEAAEMHGTRKAPIFAFGTGKNTARQAVVQSLEVGPAVSESVPGIIMPMPSVLGADGLLGLSFLRRFSFQLDYERKLLRFATAESGIDTPGKGGLTAQIDGLLLAVPAELDGIPARFIVDTGAGQSLILHPWFVEKQKLRERYSKRLNLITGGGLLGLKHGELVRAQTFKLGSCTLTNVSVEFSSKDDSQAVGQIAGYIGAEVLRRFTLTFNAASQQMFFEPNAGFADKLLPPACVMSGMVCFPEGENWIVRDIIPDSPATEAGVRLGDLLLEVEGKSVQSLQFGEVKAALRAKPGTRIRLRLQTKQEPPREAVLTLRDLLAP